MNQPPKIFLRFLEWYCKPRALEVIEGDLYELFEDRCEKLGARKARLFFAWDVIRFLRWRYVKGLDDIPALISLAMIRNYFKIAIRNLLRYKFFSFINIMGLSVGVVCCLAIMVFVKDEVSYDQFLPDHERVFRVSLNERGTNTPALLVYQMRQDFPEVETGTRLYGPFDATVNIDSHVFKQGGAFIGDSTFFEVFQTKFLAGSEEYALKKPNSVVITKSFALNHFKGKDPIGQVMKVDGENHTVTAVVVDCPGNSHMQYEFVVDIPRESWATKGNWTANNFMSYLKLRSDANPDLLQSKFQAFVEKYVGPGLVKFTGHSSFEEYLADGYKFNYHLIPVADIHLEHPRMSLGGTPGSKNNVYIFSIVAFFILLIACINFINLSTSRSALRSKEVGIRKVLGSLKKQLVFQFLTESLIISGVSLVIALGILLLVLPGFNELAGKSFSILEVLQVENILILIAAGIVTGLIAGSYPAFYLSSIKPIKALKGVFKDQSGSNFLKKGLMTFQFSISIVLLAFTLIIYLQLKHITKAELGIAADQTLVVKNVVAAENSFSAFENSIRKIPEVETTVISNHYPSGGASDWSYTTVEDVSKKIGPYHAFVGAEFQEVLGLSLVDGRFFEKSRALDTTTVVVNEAFLDEVGWESGVGKVLSRGNGKNFKIIGVLKDYRFGSMRADIQPMLLRYAPSISQPELHYGGGHMLIRVSKNYDEVIRSVKSEWIRFVEEEPFEYVFLDDSFNRLYGAERKFGKLFLVFSVLAIFVACLGLLALASFTLQRRLKEIAIRKVFGASEYQLSGLIINSFTKLIGIGALIGIPLAYYMSDKWLENFAERLTLNPILFLIPIIAVLLLSWVTVGFQSFKTARTNPAKVLKDE